MSVLGDRLREEREKRGWSQVYVAQRLGMKRSSTYANWEYGLRDPDTDMLARLAQLYEVSTDYLTGVASSKTTHYKTNNNTNERIIKEIVEKYDVDLSEPGTKEKLEQIIRLVLDDRQRKK